MDRKRWLILLTILGPIACLFGPVLLSDRSFAMRDAAHFYYPLFEWTTNEWAAGRVPLWNPYENGGLPVVADASSSIFYPGKLLFALPLDFTFNYKLYIIAHVFLAAAGVYRLARHWQSSEYAAAVAAIAYALGGNVVFQYCNVVFLIGAAWLPWALQSAETMFLRQSWRSALALGAILALMILGGDPQAAMHTLLIVAAYLVFLRGSQPTESVPAPAGRQRFLVRGLLFCLAAGSGFLLAAVQILPSSEAAKGSERAAYNSPRNVYEAAEFLVRDPETITGLPQRSVVQGLFGQPDGSGHHQRVYDFSLAPWRVAEFIWPNVSGRMFPTMRRWAAELIPEGRVWTPSLYLGLLPLLLAICQLRLWRGDARSRWLSWTMLFFLVASFGFFGIGWLINWAAREVAVLRGVEPAAEPWLGNPVGGLYWLMVVLLPTYVYFRYPAKLLVIVSLAISLLAARGWDEAFRTDSPRLQRALKWLGTGSFALAAVAWIALGFVRFDGWPADAALGPFDIAGAKWDVLTALLQAGIVAWCGLELIKRAHTEPTANWQALAVVLTAVELTLANYWLVQSAPAQLWREKPSVAATIFANRLIADESQSPLPPRVYRGRFSGWRPDSFALKTSGDRMTEMDRWERDTLFPKYQMPAEISLVESYGSLKSLDYQIFLDMAKFSGPLQSDQARLPHPAALRLLGTEHLLIPDSYKPGFAERIEPPPEDAKAAWPENASLWKMKRPLPRAWIVHRIVELEPLANPGDIAAVEARSLEVLLVDRRARDFAMTAVVEVDRADSETATVAGGATVDSADSLESCAIEVYEPQRVRIEATLIRPGLVVLSDALAPGWVATVTPAGGPTNSRREVPILQANRVMRGVQLPAGQHVLEFHYRPHSFYRGAIISAISWTLLITLAVALRSRRPVQM